MIVLTVIVTLILSFLWNTVILYAGARIIGSENCTWKTCAGLVAAGFAVSAVLLGIAALSTLAGSLILSLLNLVALIWAIWYLFRLTMNTLDISFWGCIGLSCVMSGLNWVASFLIGMLETILPGISIITDRFPC